LYFTEPENEDHDDDGNLARNNVYAYELVDNRLVNPKLLIQLPIQRQAQHNGGVLLIGPDDNLYVMIGEGDTGFEEQAIKSKTRNYKDGLDPDGRGGILKVTQDGKPTNKEGILGNSIPLNLYYAYGIRNSFGMDFDPLSGNLWDTENGPFFGDEINFIGPGFNSGWVLIHGLASFNRDYSLSELETFGRKGYYSDPEFNWNVSIGVTALKFLNSDKLGKQYENDIFVGDFHYGYLYHFDLNKKRTGLSLTGDLVDNNANDMDELQNVTFGEGFGGITDIEVGPDGNLYILSLKQGGDNCSNGNTSTHCVNYGSDISGDIFKIVPKQS
jgi:glucose/arabinose dehydrogenase